jgi:hypothetical protein
LSTRVIAAGFLSLLISSTLVMVPPGTAHASGFAGWTGHAGHTKRPQFRPWQPRVEQRAIDARWRPHRATGPQAAATRYAAAPPRQAPLIAPEPRYTAPVTRAFARSVNAGVRFRPNSRAAVAPADQVQTTPATLVENPGLHRQFRPKPERKRVSYEELQARSGASNPQSWPTYAAQPVYGSPTSTAMAPVAGYPSYWRTW